MANRVMEAKWRKLKMQKRKAAVERPRTLHSVDKVRMREYYHDRGKSPDYIDHIFHEIEKVLPPTRPIHSSTPKRTIVEPFNNSLDFSDFRVLEVFQSWKRQGLTEFNYIAITKSPLGNLYLWFQGTRFFFMFDDFLDNQRKLSIEYPSRERAMRSLRYNTIEYLEQYPISTS